MGLIKTICNEKENPIEVSLNHIFPTDKNGRKTYSSQFKCPYGYNGGLVTCCYPYKVETKGKKPSWLIPIEGKYPNKPFTSTCPIYRQLTENYCPTLSLAGEEVIEIPSDLLGSLHSNLSEEDRDRIKRFDNTKS